MYRTDREPPARSRLEEIDAMVAELDDVEEQYARAFAGELEALSRRGNTCHACHRPITYASNCIVLPSGEVLHRDCVRSVGRCSRGARAALRRRA